jgi:hypothetical protein
MHRFSIQTMMIAIDDIAVVLAPAPQVMQAIHECGECYQVESCEKHLHNIALGLLSVHNQEKRFPPGRLRSGRTVPRNGKKDRCNARRPRPAPGG